MNLRIASALKFTLALSIFLSLAAIGFSQSRIGVDGGSITIIGTRDVTPVLVRSSDSRTLSLVKAAISVHGGFNAVNSMGEAAFGIRIDPVGGAGARLTITSGVPEQTMLSESFPGRTLREATLKAVDRAVYRTTGKPGFFSGKLAYISEETGMSEVYTSDLLFGNIVKWTSDSVESVRPRWSPDGSALVYTTYLKGYPDIYQLDMRNNRRDLLVNFKGTNIGARYSPDGSRMAMIVTGGRNADVWIREASGQFRNLTKSNGLEAAPSWSPDGSRLVFSSDQNGGVQLFSMSASGGSMRRLRTDISGYCAEPDWNPVESNLIAFTAAQGSGYQLAVYDSVAGKSVWITSERGDAIEPHWLNDGRHIVFTHRRANNHQIKIVDTVTKRSAVLSGSKTSVSQPSFIAQ